MGWWTGPGARGGARSVGSLERSPHLGGRGGGTLTGWREARGSDLSTAWALWGPGWAPVVRALSWELGTGRVEGWGSVRQAPGEQGPLCSGSGGCKCPGRVSRDTGTGTGLASVSQGRDVCRPHPHHQPPWSELTAQRGPSCSSLGATPTEPLVCRSQHGNQTIRPACSTSTSRSLASSRRAGQQCPLVASVASTTGSSFPGSGLRVDAGQ